MQHSRSLRTQIITYARRLHERGWVANHDGNLTAALPADHGYGAGYHNGGPQAKRYVATPTATSKGDVDDGNIIEVDARGKRLAGHAKPFGELGMHLAIYRQRDDVAAVIHAHPPYATAISCSANNPIFEPFIAEAVVSLGAKIPKLPFAMPGRDAEHTLEAACTDVDAALLQNHGLFAWGQNLEQAYLRLELVEHLARIATLAAPHGGIEPLPRSAFAPLLAARARAGLGAAADAAANAATDAAAQTWAPRDSGTAPHRQDADGLADAVREELARIERNRRE